MLRCALLTLAVFLSWSQASMAYESPHYTVVLTTDHYEIRDYPSLLVAETRAEGDFGAARNQAFRRLFDYIRGANTGGREISMTVPVTSRTDRGPGQEIAMTVPVTTSPGEGPDSQLMRFFLASDMTLENAPRPSDSRVSLHKLPPRRVAVRQFSGRSSQSNFQEQEVDLLQALERDGVATEGQVEFAAYNSPFTPWFMRRNEAMIAIRAD